MRVKEIMKKIIAIDGNMKLRAAAKIMSEKKVGSLVVISGDKIKGIVTERDVLKNVNSLGDSVSKIMSKDVITIAPNASLDDAAKLMAEKEIKRLPVLDKDELVGIVTATDILANSDSLNENFFFED